MKTINSQIQELQQPPRRTRKSPHHYRVKLLKNSDWEILKQPEAGRLHRETEIWMKADFSRKQCISEESGSTFLNYRKKENCQPKNLNSDKISSKNEGEYSHYGRIWQFLIKLNIDLPYNPATVPLDIYPSELKIYVRTKTYTWMFIAMKMTFKRWTNKENGVHIYNRILFNNKKEQAINSCNMNES